ncbi:Zn-dependent hydrolase [Mesorhizobium microcysteis]|uniref:Zn-dependent hydrolase n=1 Tax=Neoaquamicrobium microcysteis TaxID=2682781 RepID=A0A5D4GTU1_9HYPH|nr:Zn-dependent hydrolase [Mesorhizobium microcysteis]TYR30685.1 Zn-dependent hydrolase [Mesorhizobium microcysteis]
MSALAAADSNDRELDIETARYLFEEIAALTPDTQGVSRPAFSQVETETLRFLEDFARGHGLEVWYDAGANANFSLPADRGAERFVVVGSHVDSVPYGGNFDGLAGVVAGLVCLVRAHRRGERFARPVHVLAMRGEESAWFGPCYIGSKALTGTLGESELKASHKGDGRTLDDHMADIGLPMDKVRAGTPLIDVSAIEAYLELHIEQGPLLVGKDIPAAVVSGIRGNFRHRKVRCIGEAGHSGAVPKAYRRDAVLAMADLLVRMDESWSTILNMGDDLVLTSGMVGTDPQIHAMSKIPEEVCFSLDIRSQSARTLDDMRRLLKAEMRQVEKERKVRFELDEEMRVEPAMCDSDLVEGLKAAMERTGQEPFVMPSGGGHDAAVFSAAGIPSAMVFVRNRNGSHNPHEAMELPDFADATDIVYEFLARHR